MCDSSYFSTSRVRDCYARRVKPHMQCLLVAMGTKLPCHCLLYRQAWLYNNIGYNDICHNDIRSAQNLSNPHHNDHDYNDICCITIYILCKNHIVIIRHVCI